MGNALVKSAVVDMGLQWALFLVAAYFKTEKFYDLAGSGTFILLAVQSLISNRKLFPRQVVQSSLVCMWAMRLGMFLFMRVLRSGHDSRFNRVRDNPKMFFIYWTVQGLWVWLTLLPTLIVNSKQADHELCTRDYIGWGVWLAGMLIECIADYQKYNFRSNDANKNQWISHGLWGIVRHPNYLGEIMLWSGLFISASSTFKISGCSTVGQPQQPIPFVPGAVPPAYYAQPPPGGAPQVAYMPASAAQPFPGGQVVYMPGSAQPVTIMPQPNIMSYVSAGDIISDYRAFAVVTLVIFTLVAAPTLVFSIPAVILAYKSRTALKEGKLKDAKNTSLASAYLSIAAIVGGLVFIFGLVFFTVYFRIEIRRSLEGVG